MRIAGRLPSAAARWCPISSVVTRRFVSPNDVRESHVGTRAPMPAHMCMIGDSGTLVTPNGITAGLWGGATENTPGRAADTAPGGKRPAYGGRPAGGVA